MTRYNANHNTSQSIAADPTQTTRPLYHRKDLIIKNNTIDIGGTLTWPKDQKANTLVIMISGSGAQNRDATMAPVSDFKPFALLADSLTTADLATFRYDDRGVGKSTGNFAETTLDMLASDVEVIITEFTDGSGPNFDEIILLGHSQGGVIGGKVAVENNRVDKLVLMASPGVSLSKTVIKQVELVNKQHNIPDSVITQNIKMQKAIFDTLRGSQNFSKFGRNISKKELNYLQSPAYFSFLDYEPTQNLCQLNIPVLVLLGGKDTQVTVEVNKRPIKKALEVAKVPYKLQVFKNANHPFQKAKTGQAEEYNSLPNEFVEGFSSTISQWLKEE